MKSWTNLVLSHTREKTELVKIHKEPQQKHFIWEKGARLEWRNFGFRANNCCAVAKQKNDIK